jgi:hypothetical protein
VSKRVLTTLDLTTLLVALDHVEEFGPFSTVPDPQSAPRECIYLKYIPDDRVAALAARLPHVDVLFRTPAGSGRNKVVRKVFSKAAILHVLRFAFPTRKRFTECFRDLGSVNQKYWRVLKPGESQP